MRHRSPLASHIAAPAATTILSDYGADVIQVETPRTGAPQAGMVRSLHTSPRACRTTASHRTLRAVFLICDAMM